MLKTGRVKMIIQEKVEKVYIILYLCTQNVDRSLIY